MDILDQVRRKMEYIVDSSACTDSTKKVAACLLENWVEKRYEIEAGYEKWKYGEWAENDKKDRVEKIFNAILNRK